MTHCIQRGACLIGSADRACKRTVEVDRSWHRAALVGESLRWPVSCPWWLVAALTALKPRPCSWWAPSVFVAALVRCTCCRMHVAIPSASNWLPLPGSDGPCMRWYISTSYTVNIQHRCHWGIGHLDRLPRPGQSAPSYFFQTIISSCKVSPLCIKVPPLFILPLKRKRDDW